LLSAAITASGCSVRGFHRDYLLGQNGKPGIRTVWRWLKGQHKMPDAVRGLCEALVNPVEVPIP
jgi:hypothetical protein